MLNIQKKIIISVQKNNFYNPLLQAQQIKVAIQPINNKIHNIFLIKTCKKTSNSTHSTPNHNLL